MIPPALLLPPTALVACLNADPDPGARAEAALRALAARSPTVASVTTLVKSGAGHDVPVLRVGKRPEAEGGPAVLLVAGIDGRHRVGVEAAVAVAEKVAADPPAWLDRVSLYVVPCLNPDAFAAGNAPPLVDYGRVRVPSDADRDRRTGEDAAEDLNGDGVITLMRVKDPRPGLGVKATMADDPEWPGLMKSPEGAKGERAVWAVLAEGRDKDGDGKYAEDGPGPEGYSGGGGIDMDRNFPVAWPEFEDGAGDRPLALPEGLALVRWCQEHAGVVSVVVFGMHDTVVNIPEANKMDASGQVPRGILGDDKPVYEGASAKYRELTGYTDAPRRDNAGSFAAWAYASLGVPVFETPVWVRPDLVKDEKRVKPPESPTAEGEKKDGDKKEAPKRPEAKTDEQKWVRYFEDYGVRGFAAWAPFQHPQLGPVEIGGFLPGSRINPPAAFMDSITAAHAEFVGWVAGQTASVSATAAAERAGPGLWTIRARAVNGGAWPTPLAMGARARSHGPVSLTLEVDPAKLVAGRKRQQESRLAGSGGQFDAEWTVLAADGGTVRVVLATPDGGRREVRVKLGAE